MSRPCLRRWFSGLTGAPNGHRSFAIAAGVGAVATLASAVATGFAPLTPSIAIAVMVPAAVIDVEQRRLPDSWTIAALIALLLTFSVGTAFGASTAITFGGLLGGAAAMAVPVLIVHLVSPDAMGFGDVKAAAVLGAAVGTIDWRLGAVALCLAALAGGAAGVIGRQRKIPFGPFLVAGAWVCLLAHEFILQSLFTGGPTP